MSLVTSVSQRLTRRLHLMQRKSLSELSVKVPGCSNFCHSNNWLIFCHWLPSAVHFVNIEYIIFLQFVLWKLWLFNSFVGYFFTKLWRRGGFNPYQNCCDKNNWFRILFGPRSTYPFHHNYIIRILLWPQPTSPCHRNFIIRILVVWPQPSHYHIFT